MKKIVVLGIGKCGSIVINEIIKRKAEYVEFATAEDTSAIDKILNNTDMIFIVFEALGKEQNTDLALEITKAAKNKIAMSLICAIKIMNKIAKTRNIKFFIPTCSLKNLII